MVAAYQRFPDEFGPGDPVLVYPHGDRAQCLTGKVLSFKVENQTRILVSISTQTLAGTILNCLMLAYRIHAVEGHAIGPWIELFGGGHYEIEKT